MQRDKGRKAEAEVAKVYQRHGFTVRGLEAGGDHLASGHGLLIHSEVKRHETLRLPLWARQSAAEAPMGSVPIVAFRRNHEDWQAIVPERPVWAHLKACDYTAGIHYSLTSLNGVWYARLELEDLLAALTGERAGLIGGAAS